MYQEKLNEILLKSKPSKYIYELIENREMEKYIPELIKLKGFDQHTPYHDKDVLDHTLAVVDNIEPKLNLRMSALLHDISKPDCFTLDTKGRGHFYGHHIKSSEKSEEILKRLGYDNDFIEDVKILIRYHYIKDIKNINTLEGLKKFINDVGVNRLSDMFELNIADIKGKANPDKFDDIEFIREKCYDYLNSVNYNIKAD